MPFDIYLIVIFTLIILGVVCILKNIKEGFMAAIIGGIITVGVFIIHYIYYLLNSFFVKTGIGFKDVLTWVICIAITCIVFLIIIFFIKFLGIKKR